MYYAKHALIVEWYLFRKSLNPISLQGPYRSLLMLLMFARLGSIHQKFLCWWCPRPTSRSEERRTWRSALSKFMAEAREVAAVAEEGEEEEGESGGPGAVVKESNMATTMPIVATIDATIANMAHCNCTWQLHAHGNCTWPMLMQLMPHWQHCQQQP